MSVTKIGKPMVYGIPQIYKPISIPGDTDYMALFEPDCFAVVFIHNEEASEGFYLEDTGDQWVPSYRVISIRGNQKRATFAEQLREVLYTLEQSQVPQNEVNDEPDAM